MKTIAVTLIVTLILLAGCGGSVPVVKASGIPGQHYRLYPAAVQATLITNPPDTPFTLAGYWIVDQGEGTSAQYFYEVDFSGARAETYKDQWWIDFDNAVLVSSGGQKPVATLTQGQ